MRKRQELLQQQESAQFTPTSKRITAEKAVEESGYSLDVSPATLGLPSESVKALRLKKHVSLEERSRHRSDRKTVGVPSVTSSNAHASAQKIKKNTATMHAGTVVEPEGAKSEDEKEVGRPMEFARSTINLQEGVESLVEPPHFSRTESHQTIKEDRQGRKDALKVSIILRDKIDSTQILLQTSLRRTKI